jgi:Zn-dependent peptidase ImmA (M78 family)/transcriptional regulator with XRE-family HTH domain
MADIENNIEANDANRTLALPRASASFIRSGEFNPAMLTTAREARHLSQAELAESMGVSQPLINQWEAVAVPGSPIKRPGVEQVEKLAQLLQFHPGLFYVSRPTRLANLSEFYHRAFAKAKRMDVRAAHARCGIIDLQVDRLLAFCPAPEDRIPKIDPDDHGGDIEKIAAMTRMRMGISPGPVENLVDAIEACGGIVIDRDLEIDNVDALCRWVPGLPKLFLLNGAQPGDRMRLTLAHELGHTVMHFNRDAVLDVADSAGFHQIPDSLPFNRDAVLDLAERQAQRFAASFLLPANEVRCDFGVKLDIPKLSALKRKWRVSMQALAYRAHQIGCINEIRYRSIFQQMSREGWRKSEPIEVRRESPRAFKRLLHAHLKAGYTEGQLAELLFVSSERLHELLVDANSPDWQDAGVRMRIAR